MKLHPLTWLTLVAATALLGWLALRSPHRRLAANDTSGVVATNTTISTSVPDANPAKNPAGMMAAEPAVGIQPKPDVAATGAAGIIATNNQPVETDPMDAKLKLAELWQSTNRLEAVKAITPYLTNADAEVRSMAIESMKQVGDHDTAKLLQALAATVSNNADRKALIDAANFLYLPTLTDALKGQPINAVVPRQPKPTVPRPPIEPPPDIQPSGPLAPDAQPPDPSIPVQNPDSVQN